MKELWDYQLHGDEGLYFDIKQFSTPLEYRTDEEGSGLWIRDPKGNWSQIKGTCQFKLPFGKGLEKKLSFLKHYFNCK
jgi:hypothetical protein